MQPITVNGKIYNTNLLLKFKYCIRRLMVLKEVDFTTLYICVFIVQEKSIHYSLFTSVRKVQHCTGYPLIQVEIVSVCKSHYVLAGFPKFFVDFLVLGVCGHFLTVSSVGAGVGGAGAGAGMFSAGAGMSSAISSLLSKI